MKSAREWKQYYTTQEFQRDYTYEGHDLGVSCSEEETSFLLWSPCAEAVTLHFYENGSDGEAYKSLPMKREEKGVWAYRTAGDLHGVYYDYDVTVEGETRRTADPYAKACGVNGKRSMAVNLARTDPAGWEEDCAPCRPMENIIYELHVKEFSWDKSGGFPEGYRGKYKAFLCEDTSLCGDGLHKTGCAYLRDLGVTHVQLMPVYDYGSVDEAGEKSEFNWGYDPVNYNVPEGSYATDAQHGEVRIRELKEMVQALHRQGFRVIMDVVYNHTYLLDSWFQRTVPWYYYRVHEDGSVSDGSACGNDTANERPMCGKYILDSVLYWAEEYHIDGFRFDLMGLLDVELMNRIRRALDERFGKGEKLLYGEPWAAADTAMEGAAKGALKENLSEMDDNIGIFCDDTRNTVKGAVFDADKNGFVNGAQGMEPDILNSARAWQGTNALCVKSPAQIITYVSAHDNHTLWDRIMETVPDETSWKRVNKLTAAIYMTCQGSIFLLSGEEFARTKEGEDNTFRSPISLNRLDWRRAWENRELVEYYRGLIALRKQLPGLCDKTPRAGARIYGMWTKPQLVGFMVDNRDDTHTGPCEKERCGGACMGSGGKQKYGLCMKWDMLCIVYNAGEAAQTVTLPEGAWQVLADGENSFLWKEQRKTLDKVCVEAYSALILGILPAD